MLRNVRSHMTRDCMGTELIQPRHLGFEGGYLGFEGGYLSL